MASSPLVLSRSSLQDLLELTKPRITLTVVTTTLAGYFAASGPSSGVWHLLAALTGTALVAAGASAANMLLEHRIDGLMVRTRSRPLPTGRLNRMDAAVFASLLTVSGTVVLARFNGILPASVALATWLAYVLVYTPLKPHTSLATLVGGVPGALPPVIGWTAARGSFDPGAGVLFAIVFLWQIPHFLAIAALYREDYARAGLKVLPLEDPDGRLTARQIVAHSVALWLVSLAPALGGMAGRGYLVAASLLGLVFVYFASRFARTPTRVAARGLFGFSVAYLLLLCLALIVDRPGVL